MATSSEMYNDAFYKMQKDSSYISAINYLPALINLLDGQIGAIADFGCGVGTWLRAFMELGYTEVFGFDGDYVDRSQLLIPEDRFYPCDLENAHHLRSEIFPAGNASKWDRTKSLAMSVECAEHLSEGSASEFIETICSYSDVILFGAAIPFQGGINHINEQWQSYWANLFKHQGYVVFDDLRSRIMGRGDVLWYYVQNTLLYVNVWSETFKKLTEKGLRPVSNLAALDFVMPDEHLRWVMMFSEMQQMYYTAQKTINSPKA